MTQEEYMAAVKKMALEVLVEAHQLQAATSAAELADDRKQWLAQCARQTVALESIAESLLQIVSRP